MCTSLAPGPRGNMCLVREGGAVVPVLTSAASAPWLPSPGAGDASHSDSPKTAKFEGCSPSHLTWGLCHGAGGAGSPRVTHRRCARPSLRLKRTKTTGLRYTRTSAERRPASGCGWASANRRRLSVNRRPLHKSGHQRPRDVFSEEKKKKMRSVSRHFAFRGKSGCWPGTAVIHAGPGPKPRPGVWGGGGRGGGGGGGGLGPPPLPAPILKPKARGWGPVSPYTPPETATRPPPWRSGGWEGGPPRRPPSTRTPATRAAA